MTAARGYADEPVAGAGFTLRPLRIADAPDIVAACSDEQTQAWLPLPHPYTRADALRFITEVAAAQHESGDGIVFGIEVDGRLHGCIDLKHTDWQEATTEVGYWVAPWARGHGLAARACRMLAEWALREQGLERVVLHAATGNVASNRAAERAGFVREGVARNAGHVHAGRVDTAVWSLVPGDLR
ncbi:MAG: GNAT family N-acetyltransferase [Intrasporangium sp.]|uniref:GNAT family N-acetyltransferase n=1 Tax=Intrasporangium sp. TaxID=1925024 RepID=UPI0026482B98|nr:GNAT family N-acetyltransferase [Intrasporangium sp.]MDN5796337.1 GNAT family N-acetyltransferase [Intrasporangium sp.]